MDRGKKILLLALGKDVHKDSVEKTNDFDESSIQCNNSNIALEIDNENDLLYYGINFNSTTLKKKLTENNVENYEEEMFENSDDSVKDPDYSASDCSSSIFADDNADENVLQMAREIEKNLTEVNNNSMNEKLGNDQKETKRGRKVKRNLGIQYVTAKGKQIRERRWKELKDCRMNCKSKISPTMQKELFDRYWSLGDFNLRVSYLSGLISVEEKKTEKKIKSTTRPRIRNHTNYYYLKVSGKRIKVCQKCFRFTFDETEQFIKTVVRKMLENPGAIPAIDQRGCHQPPNKLHQEKLDEVRRHISSFPSYESHYTRRNISLRYLHSDLTMSKMYSLYREKFENPVSQKIYYDIFHSMNLKIKSPKVNRCTKCDLFKIQLNATCSEQEKSTIKSQQEEHHKAADLAYECKRMDKELSKMHNSIKVYTFDLQQCFPTPLLRTAASFYKRSLWTYNLTIHDCVSGQPLCFMWHEAIAHRGRNEIASCLYKHSMLLSDDIKYIKFYSDSCFGQNKNSLVATMFLMVAQLKPNIQVIDHKFLVPGHTHMECDVYHSIIQRKIKKTSVEIHHPRDWYNFVRSIGNKHSFIVHEMHQNSFYDFALLSKKKFTWRKVDQEGNRFNWQEVKWLRFTKDFGTIQYKNTLNEEELFKVLSIRRRGINSVSENDLKTCYSEPVKISNEKRKDLIDTLPFINSTFHDFYRNLISQNIPDYHPDLTELDEEEQN